MYIVVQVQQCCDDVEGVVLIDKAKSQEEADAIIAKIRKEEAEHNMAQLKYIENFVESIKLPETIPGNRELFDNWRKFTASIFTNEYDKTYIWSTSEFKHRIKHYLIGGYTCFNLENYNPPYKGFTSCGQNLFILKVDV